ncbi:ABC transporter permease subunit [Vibrio lentus]|nr:ABC transporter permease subunit [Vibrio lentus]
MVILHRTDYDVILNLLFCSLVGYAFVMFEFKHGNRLSVFVMATMMLPAFLSMILPLRSSILVRLMNTPKRYIFQCKVGAMGIFLMRHHISSVIPRELIEAARMDGCGEFRFFRIIIPLITPAF